MPKDPFKLVMTDPEFADGLPHALGQLVEHAIGHVDEVTVLQTESGKLELRVTISGVDWDSYHIGERATIQRDET